MSSPADIRLPLRIGARTIGSIRRRLVRMPLSLAQAREKTLPPLPPIGDAHGYLITSVPTDLINSLRAGHPRLRLIFRQRYQRCFAALDGDFDGYMARFSSKTRATLRRKLRKFAELSGGTIDLRLYASEEQVDEFYDLARALSSLTYQERLLDAGMPAGDAMRDELRQRARQGSLRGWILFLEGKPVSYLYAPAVGDTLIYAYLGYDPAHAALSPGTVLQLEAMRQLMDEGIFRLFDFTEGDGQHKRQFATGAIDCVDLLLLRPTIANRAAANLLTGFDAAVAGAKRLVRVTGLERFARAAAR